MRNADEQIDRVLNALRDVETPIGVEGRILKAAQQRATSKPVRWRTRPWVWGGGLASAAAVCVIAVMLHRERAAPMVATLPGTALAVTPRIGVAPPLFSPVAVARSKAKTRHDSRVIRTSQVSSGELQAASFPAPPMPLTEQEKLLLRIVHKGDPVQLAMLDPVHRSVQDARGKAEFQQFFEPLTTGENK